MNDDEPDGKSVKIMWITPDMALDMLTRTHSKQRPVDKTAVSRYARLMKEGGWRLTNQGIGLDHDGSVSDGQHRLRAIVEAEIPIRMMVTKGVTMDDALSGVDKGRIRTAGQDLGMRGESNSHAKAAICRTIWIAETGRSVTERAFFDDTWPVLERYRAPIEECIAKDTSHALTAPVRAAIVMSFSLPRWRDFLDGVITGVGLGAGDPRLALRNRIMIKADPGGVAMTDRFLRTVCSIDLFTGGEQQNKIYISTKRYRRWCERIGIQVSQAMLSFAENASDRTA